MQQNRAVRSVTIALLAVMTIPVVTQRLLQGQIVRDGGAYAIFRSQDDEGLLFQGEDIREDVKAYQGTVRAKRRAYSRSVEQCRDRLRTEEGVVCPDINDASSYEFTGPVRMASQSAKQEASVRSAAPLARTLLRDLSTAERELLRTNTRAGFCNSSLGKDLYDLCRSIVGEDEKAMPMGIINDNVFLHSRFAAPPASLKLRLRMMDEAISGSKGRRTGIEGPMRFQGGLKKD